MIAFKRGKPLAGELKQKYRSYVGLRQKLVGKCHMSETAFPYFGNSSRREGVSFVPHLNIRLIVKPFVHLAYNLGKNTYRWMGFTNA